MRKLGFWIFLFVITWIGVMVGWNWHAFRSGSPILETSFREEITQRSPFNASPKSSAPFPDALPIEAPAIRSERILSDLQSLAFKRYTEADRAQARTYITEQLQQAGWLPQLQVFDNGVNIYAERPGTTPEAGSILVATHYDSVERSPGADDNATGVAAVLEIARLLGQVPTPRSLKVAFFDLEESGLLGSLAFAEDAAQLDNLQGALIMEMIGYACHTEGCQNYPVGLPIRPPTHQGDFLAVIGDSHHMPLINAFHQAVRPQLPQVLSLPIPLLGPLTPDLFRSDHAPFWRKGIGAVMVTDTANFRNPNYHKETDTPDTIDPAFFAGATQLVVNAATALLSTQDSLATPTRAPSSQGYEFVSPTPL